MERRRRSSRASGPDEDDEPSSPERRLEVGVLRHLDIPVANGCELFGSNRSGCGSYPTPCSQQQVGLDADLSVSCGHYGDRTWAQDLSSPRIGVVTSLVE